MIRKKTVFFHPNRMPRGFFSHRTPLFATPPSTVDSAIMNVAKMKCKIRKKTTKIYDE
jgi:hypothetical protein